MQFILLAVAAERALCALASATGAQLSCSKEHLAHEELPFLPAESASMAKRLVDWTGYFPFKDLSGPELFALFHVAQVMRENTYKAFDEDTDMFPMSILAADYLVSAVFKNQFVSSREKHRYFRNVTKLMCKHGKFDILGHLIEVTDDYIVASISKSKYFLRGMLHKLSEANLPSAVKLFRMLHHDQRCGALVAILLAPMDKDRLQLALSLLPPQPDISEMLNYMTWMAGSECLEYFSREKETVYKNNMVLLDILERRASGETEFRMVASVRLLYSIRLGFQRGGIESRAAFNNMPIVPVTSDELFDEICALNMLSKDSRSIRLLNAVISSQNRDLFARVFPHALALGGEAACRIRSHPHARQLLSLKNRKLLVDRNDNDLKSGLEVVRLCRAENAPFPSDEWISRFRPEHRPAILAEIGDEDRFRASIIALRGNSVRSATEHIIYSVSNPVSFIKIILETRDIAELLWLPNTLKFIRVLLLNENDNLLELFGVIVPGSKFFEALLDDQTLADAFHHNSSLRRSIYVNVDSFSDRRCRDITRLLDILQVQVNADAFNLCGKSELIGSFMSPRGCSLPMLDVHAQEPGFLAQLAMARSYAWVIGDAYNLTFERLNPLKFHTFHLLSQWLAHDPSGFVTNADWRIVLAFFGAKPDQASWNMIRNTAFPTTLEQALMEHFAGKTVNFEFASSSAQAAFENGVIPFIKAHCHINCSVSMTHQVVSGISQLVLGAFW